MNNPLRLQVLQRFKSLHKARKEIFSGDQNALSVTRMKINEEFVKNRHVTDTQAIKELIKFSNEVENYARATIIQAKEVRPGVFRANIREEVAKIDNVPYKDNPALDVNFGNKVKGKCSREPNIKKSEPS